jgi:phosphate-selective porin OprO and OprP
MTSKQTLIGATAAGAFLLCAHPTAAQTSSVNRQIDSLQSQIQQLQQQLQSLQSQVNQAQQNAAQAQATAAQAQAQAQPKANGAIPTMSPGNRPGICTADGQNCIELTSRLQFDFANYLNVHPQQSTGPHSLTSGVNARRARIGVLGKFAGDWNYALIFDAGGSSDGTQQSIIENAYVTYNGFRPVAIDLGYIDVPWTLDESTSSNDIMFMERSEIGNVVTNLASGDNRAAFGVRSNDDRYWAGAYLTGPTSGSTHTGSNQQQLGGVARATYQALQAPDYSLHVGVDGEYVFTPRADGSSSTTDNDTVSFATGPSCVSIRPVSSIPARSRRRMPPLSAVSWRADGRASSSRASTITSSSIRRACRRRRRSRN